jgi:hypothetical protein
MNSTDRHMAWIRVFSGHFPVEVVMWADVDDALQQQSSLLLYFEEFSAELRERMDKMEERVSALERRILPGTSPPPPRLNGHDEPRKERKEAPAEKVQEEEETAVLAVDDAEGLEEKEVF